MKDNTAIPDNKPDNIIRDNEKELCLLMGI
jgi:hypothetical protein